MGFKNFILLVTLVFGLSACSRTVLFAVNTLARTADYSLQSDISYGVDPRNILDVYQPASSANGVIVFFYGGCWGACLTLPKKNYRFVAQTLTKLGYAVVIPDYRLYPDVRFGQIMQDAAAAVRWVSQNLQDENNSGTFVLMGHSAGAHIAAMLVSNENYLEKDLHRRLSGFIGLAGPYDFVFDQPYQYELFSDFEYQQTQPSYFVDGSEPPMLLLHGKQDKKVFLRNINNMAAAITQKDGRVKKRIYNDMNHTQIIAALSVPFKNRYQVVDDIRSFLMEL